MMNLEVHQVFPVRGMNSTRHLAFERFLGSGDENLVLTMLDELS